VHARRNILLFIVFDTFSFVKYKNPPLHAICRPKAQLFGHFRREFHHGDVLMYGLF